MENTKILASCSTKGGCGKTTVIKYCGILARKEGNRVLIIDFCQNGDVATRLGHDYDSFTNYVQDWMQDNCSFQDAVYNDPKTGIHFMAANKDTDKVVGYAQKKSTFKFYLALKEKIETIKHHYDYIFVDTHPSEANPMTFMAMIASDMVMIPVELDYSAVAAMERTLNMLKESEELGATGKYQIVVMNVDTTKRQSRLKELYEYLEERGIHSYPTVQRSIHVEDADFEGINIDELDKKHAKKVMSQFEEVFKIVKEGL